MSLHDRSWFGVPVTPSLLCILPHNPCGGAGRLGREGLGAGVCLDGCGMQMAGDKMLEAGAGRSCHRRLAALV